MRLEYILNMNSSLLLVVLACLCTVSLTTMSPGTIEIFGETISADHCETHDLNAGNTFVDVGDVKICNNETQLFINVTTTVGFQAVSESVKIWVGVHMNLLPSNKVAIKIGKFPYKSPLLTTDTWAVSIYFSSLEEFDQTEVDCSLQFFAFVHADVASNGGESAWGGDNCLHSSDPNNKFKNWYCNAEYQAYCPAVSCQQDPTQSQCDCTVNPNLPHCPPPPPQCRTAQSYGTHVISSVPGNPEGKPVWPQAIDQAIWGWVQLGLSGSLTIYMDATDNNPSTGIAVGTFDYEFKTTSDPFQKELEFQITANPGYHFTSYYVEAHDDSTVFSDPSVPGEFHITQEISAQTYVFDSILGGNGIDLRDFLGNGDGLWVIYHGTFCIDS